MEAKNKKRSSYSNLRPLIEQSLESIVFENTGLKGYPTLFDNCTKAAVIFGDNAAGKSLFLTALQAFIGPLKESGDETFSISMKVRTKSGMGSWIYLDESISSTGANSVNVARGAFHNANGRERPVWLLFDEPDIGLSDKFAGAMGKYIGQEINKANGNVRGTVIVTHSRALIRGLLSTLESAPHEVSMGAARRLDDFLNDTSVASVEELIEFTENASATLKAVAAALRRD